MRGKPPQVTRIPPWRVGSWVKLGMGAPADLYGKVREVRSLTCSVRDVATWRVSFNDGRSVEWHCVERFATEAEIKQAEMRKGH